MQDPTQVATTSSLELVSSIPAHARMGGKMPWTQEREVNVIACWEKGSRRRCRAHAVISTIVGSRLEEGRGSRCQGRKRRRWIQMELAYRLPLLPLVRGAATRSDLPWRGPPPTDVATRGGRGRHCRSRETTAGTHTFFFRIHVELHLSWNNIYCKPLAVQPPVVSIGMILYLLSWWRTSSPRARPVWVEPAMGAVEGCRGVRGR
jgi:hypothetical protein